MADIVELNSIAVADLVKVDGIAIADIVSINGQDVPAGGGGGFLDLTTFTETDPGSDLTVTEAACTFAGLDKDVATYCYYDYGASYFDEFALDFECEITASDTGGAMFLFAVSNTLGSADDMITADDAIAVYVVNNAGSLEFHVRDESNDNSDSYVAGGTSAGKYYMRLTRWGTSLNLYIYTGGYSPRDDTLVDIVKITCETGLKRYLYVTAGMDDAETSKTISGYVQNVLLAGADYFSGFDGTADFTADDDTPPDPYFYRTNLNTNDLISIQSNKLNFGPPSTAVSRGNLTTKERWYLGTGAFEVHVEWENMSLGLPAAANQYCVRFGCFNQVNTNIAFIARYRSSGRNGYVSDGNRGGVGWYSFALADSAGKFKMHRISDTIYVSYWNFTLSRWEWQTLLTGRPVGTSTDSLWFRFLYEQEAGTAVSGDITAWTTVSGTLVPY